MFPTSASEFLEFNPEHLKLKRCKRPIYAKKEISS